MVGLLTTLFGCKQGIKLSNKEVEFCEIAEINQKLAKSIKELTKQPLQLIPEVNESGEVLDTKDEGLCSQTDDKNCYDYVLQLKQKFKSEGVLVFAFEDNKNQKFLAAIKGTDELDIIKWKQTNGINYGHENQDVIAKLKEWKLKNDFSILSVGMDFLEFKFVTMPTDMGTFSKDVYQFCPDIVDQGTGDLEILQDEMTRMHSVYLWWD